MIPLAVSTHFRKPWLQAMLPVPNDSAIREVNLNRFGPDKPHEVDLVVSRNLFQPCLPSFHYAATATDRGSTRDARRTIVPPGNATASMGEFDSKRRSCGRRQKATKWWRLSPARSSSDRKISPWIVYPPPTSGEKSSRTTATLITQRLMPVDPARRPVAQRQRHARCPRLLTRLR